MPLAFCILAHKNPAQVRRLVDVLQGPGHTCIIHYDRRAPASEHAAIRDIAADFSGVKVIPPRRVNWGGWSVVRAQLDMMRAALESERPWSHLFTLSGQDFPLQAVSAIDAEFGARPDESDLEWFDPFAPGRWKNARERLTHWHFDSALLDQVLRFPGLGRRIRSALGWQNRIPFMPGFRRKEPQFFRWVGGSNHYNLSRDAVAYLSNNDKAQGIAKYLRRSGIPDESFVQSVLLNSHLADTLRNDDRRAIFWESTEVPSPRILRSGDLANLRVARSAGKLFARKFDTEVDSDVLRQIMNEFWL